MISAYCFLILIQHNQKAVQNFNRRLILDLDETLRSKNGWSNLIISTKGYSFKTSRFISVV